MNNDKANRSSSVRLVEGISKVHASGSKNRLYPPRADETVVTASTASVSLQNSMSAEDESNFYAKSSTKLIANLPLGRPVLDGRKAPETSQRTLPFKHHSFLAGNNTFTIDNRYNLVKVIGSGAYGVVISATDSSSTGENKNVAIKMVPKAFQDEVDAKRILREIKLLQHFRHDNIVSIIDMMPSLVTRNIEEFKDVYIVTDLMETDLHRIIYSKQALSADHSQYFVYQILRALKYIHSANVLHRDLKPSNILVNANCDLKICDFGLARGFHPTNEDSEDETMEFDGIGHNKNSMSNQLLTE
jgi:tRNA A-37 threonylcarbamoyl transferase component Bud32